MPLFMAEGYFTRAALPAAIGGPVPGARPLTICAPLGTATGLGDVIFDRAVAVCHEHGLAPRVTSVVLAAHGSRSDPASRRAAEAHAARIAGAGRFAAVRVAFIEETPSLKSVLGALDGDAVVVGLFALSGAHADRDIPAVIAAGRGRRPGKTYYTGAIGAEPAIASVVLDLVRDAAADAFGPQRTDFR